jgi:hypothetical protein
MPSADDMAAAQQAMSGAPARSGPRGPARDDLRRAKKQERQRKKQARKRH